MAVKEEYGGDYGFLTRGNNSRDTELLVGEGDVSHRQIDRESVAAKLKAESNNTHQPVIDRKTNQPSNSSVDSKVEHADAIQKRAKSKASWWKNLFKTSKKASKVNPGRLERRKSDADLLCRQKTDGSYERQRKCKSVMVDDSVEVFEELDLKDFPLILRTHGSSDVTTGNSQPLRKLQSASCDLLDARNYDIPFNGMSDDENLNTGASDCTRDSMDALLGDHVVDSASCVNDPPGREVENSQKRKPKPVKPPRKNKKKTSINEAVDVNINVEQIRKPQKTKMRRSRSMILFKSPFSKKHKHQPIDSDAEAMKATNPDKVLLAGLKGSDDGQNVIDVYDRYPRRKSEQRKVLVHIQTKEEIRVENGVPQWDTRSYQYATQRPLLVRPRNVDHVTTHCKPKFVESSFIGTCVLPGEEKASGNGASTTPERASAKDNSKNDLGNTDTDLTIVSFQEEPKNIELNRCSRTVEAVVHENRDESHVTDDVTSTQKRKTLMKTNKSSDPNLTTAVHENEPVAQERFADTDGFSEDRSKHHFRQERSASCDALLFGRSFVLTGVANVKVPDVIVRKHPYLAELESSPVRHMAQCLRHAVQTGVPNKLSPTRAVPPAPTTENEIKNLEQMIKHPEKENVQDEDTQQESELRGSKTPEKLVERSLNNSDLPNDISPVRQPRRCHSESDLSSFHITPMALSDKYLPRESGSGRKLFRSRSARTDRLLTRMRHRIQRLEKLSDLAVHQRKDKPEMCKVEDVSIKTNAKSNANHSSKGLKVAKVSKFTVQQSKTSFAKFKQLIHSRLDKGQVRKVPSVKTNTANTERRLRFHHKQSVSENEYENLWPSTESISLNSKSSVNLTSSTNNKSKTRNHGYTNVRLKDNWGLNTNVTYSSANERPISSVVASSCTKNQGNILPLEKIQATNRACKVPQTTADSSREDRGSADIPTRQRYNDEQLVHLDIKVDDIFLSSTPVKAYPNYALRAVENVENERLEDFPQCSYNARPSVVEACTVHSDSADEYATNYQEEKTGADHIDRGSGSTSPNLTTMPTASDYFLKSLLESHEEIKKTMLQEMKKVSTKYSAEEQPEIMRNARSRGQKFNDWQGELRYHWDAGWQGNGGNSSESDTTSQDTLKCQRRDSSSSGDTLTNVCDTEEDGYATMSSTDSTLAQFGSLHCQDRTRCRGGADHFKRCGFAGGKSRHPDAVEYVIPSRGDIISEASSFMEWDCDETDL